MSILTIRLVDMGKVSIQNREFTINIFELVWTIVYFVLAVSEKVGEQNIKLVFRTKGFSATDPLPVFS